MSNPFPWPKSCRAAVSLSYDDALPVHREETAPQLEAAGLRATFYVPIDSDLLDHRDAWVRIAQAGHELGNHTIFHPCRNPGNARSWPLVHRNLCDYTPARWEDEVRVANRVLRTYDGRDRRTFGNTCCDITIGMDESPATMDALIGQHFVAGRGATLDNIIDPREASLVRLGLYNGDGRTLETLRAHLEATIEQGGWTIFMIHGVGRDHRLLIDREVHAQLVAWLAGQASRLWTAPVVEVAEHVAAVRQAG